MKKTKEAKLYKVDGIIKNIKPALGKTFNLKELQEYVGGIIDIQPLPKLKKVLVLNDEGKLIGFSKNEIVTEIWKKEYPIAEFPNNNDELIVGDVIICDEELIN